MLCDKCGKNNATTHIRSVVNGKVTEKNLCGYCAASEGLSDISHNSLTQMLAGMLGDVLAVDSTAAKIKCSCCGSSFSDIAENGKVGCAECYKTFYNELLPYIKRIHGSVKHTGKIPNRSPLAIRKEEDTIASLKLKLAELVREERFEEAATVRDEIKRAESENK